MEKHASWAQSRFILGTFAQLLARDHIDSKHGSVCIESLGVILPVLSLSEHIYVLFIWETQQAVIVDFLRNPLKPKFRALIVEQQDLEKSVKTLLQIHTLYKLQIKFGVYQQVDAADFIKTAKPRHNHPTMSDVQFAQRFNFSPQDFTA